KSARRARFRPRGLGVRGFRPRLEFLEDRRLLATITDLGTLGGISQSSAINANGQVAGTSQPTNYRAFRWEAGTMTDLGTLLGYTDFESHRNNDNGQVVGYMYSDPRYGDGFLWQNGVMIDLGTLPGDYGSIALAINDAGKVVGSSVHDDMYYH